MSPFKAHKEYMQATIPEEKPKKSSSKKSEAKK